MSDGLKNKTLHALFWSFLERFGQQGIQFIIGIILARLLLPEQFGLIAMLTIFMAIAQSFVNSGFWPGTDPKSYCQMLCMALGGVPFFFYSIYKFNSFNYPCQPL